MEAGARRAGPAVDVRLKVTAGLLGALERLTGEPRLSTLKVFYFVLPCFSANIYFTFIY